MSFGGLALLLFVWLNVVLWGGAYFDNVCIEGRLSAEQAEAINSEEWGKCPSYRDGDCKAEEKDRVLKHFCSKFSRKLTVR